MSDLLGGDNRPVSRPIRIMAAAAITLACVVTVLAAASQVTLTYYLPPSIPGGEASAHTTVFGPAVVAVVLTIVLAVAAALWLVWNIAAAPARRLWLVAVALVVAAVVTVIAVGAMDRPAF